jgi:TrmH family RNA methyltransferase
VLAAAREFTTVADAVADCTLVAGTTAVGERDLQHPLLALSDATPRLLDELTRTPQPSEALATLASASDALTADALPRIALVFGSEKTGLSNDELSHCHLLLTIPMHRHPDQRHPSMNLGQAVAVCLYELVRERPLTHTGRSSTPATAAELERLTGLFAQVLEASEYTRHHPANSNAADLRRLLLRLQFDRIDTPVWMGILRQILWRLRPPATQPNPSDGC